MLISGLGVSGDVGQIFQGFIGAPHHSQAAGLKSFLSASYTEWAALFFLFFFFILLLRYNSHITLIPGVQHNDLINIYIMKWSPQ